MIVVETMFFDSDDYCVNTEVIPCDSEKTARAVAEKVYKKILEDYIFKDDEERTQWESENIERKKDGGFCIKGGDYGYAEINIVDKELVTEDALDSLEVEVYSFY